ncbi:MacS family sensor histidine kinase [Nocardioides sp.]|uniref:MacS family sensor histidine kinase n=1 Tax=Nocardioides sp. TaxID=35761 RepID=UPI003D12EA7D
MYRALAVFRIVLLLNGIALNFVRRDNFEHPAWGTVAVVVMVLWTAFAVWAYAARRRRVPVLLIADLAVAIGLMLASPLIKGEGLQATVPGFWVAATLLAWAIHWHWKGGLIASGLITLTDVLIRNEITQTNYGNIFLLMIGGPIVGYLAESIQRMATERDRAERAAAVATERARLARAAHDGVLQVLALVKRKGAELGGEGVELARLAGDQESALRALIRQQDALVQASSDTTRDLTSAIEECGAGRSLEVSVVTPGTPVLLPATMVEELLAVVGACLDNVAVHVGELASAWVFLEDLPSSVVISVRDEGPGIPEGRLDQAVDEGRLGISESIRGRLSDLGGQADLDTGAHGTEWELTVPKP